MDYIDENIRISTKMTNEGASYFLSKEVLVDKIVLPESNIIDYIDNLLVFTNKLYELLPNIVFLIQNKIISISENEMRVLQTYIESEEINQYR